MQLQSSPLSIYLHIPFCSTRCSYCAFNTYTDLAQLIPAYVDALGREISAAAAGAPKREVHTVYVGGGTPSLLTARQFERLLSRLRHAFDLSPTCEISLEANPDDLDAGYLRSLRELGFNRLSIGMQSANPDILRLFERQHDVSAVASAMEAARRRIHCSGFIGAGNPAIGDKSARRVEPIMSSWMNKSVRTLTSEPGALPSRDEALATDDASNWNAPDTDSTKSATGAAPAKNANTTCNTGAIFPTWGWAPGRMVSPATIATRPSPRHSVTSTL